MLKGVLQAWKTECYVDCQQKRLRLRPSRSPQIQGDPMKRKFDQVHFLALQRQMRTLGESITGFPAASRPVEKSELRQAGEGFALFFGITLFFCLMQSAHDGIAKRNPAFDKNRWWYPIAVELGWIKRRT